MGSRERHRVQFEPDGVPSSLSCHPGLLEPFDREARIWVFALYKDLLGGSFAASISSVASPAANKSAGVSPRSAEDEPVAASALAC